MSATTKTLDCPNAYGGGPECKPTCQLCFGTGQMTIVDGKIVGAPCMECRNLGNVAMTPDGLVGKPCVSCGTIGDVEAAKKAIEAQQAAAANQPRPVGHAPAVYLGSDKSPDRFTQEEIAHMVSGR